MSAERDACRGVVVERGDPGYPDRLEALPDAPDRLYVRGEVDALSRPGLAVIGTRRPTPYGIASTELAVRVAAETGISIVSGGAIGCDQAAGREALERGCTHVIVLGSGADVVYPASSRGLVRRTLETGGAVVSIAPWGTRPMRFLFPRRNRIIAALSEAVFVGEAGMPSGTFTTAEAAMELGHEVLAVPGSIFSPESRGTNYLIGIGACCIADEEALELALSRIFGRLRAPRAAPSAPRYGDDRVQRVVRALASSPLRSDDIARIAGLDARGSLEFLSDLMMMGVVEQLVDGRYAPTKDTLHAFTSFGRGGAAEGRGGEDVG